MMTLTAAFWTLSKSAEFSSVILICHTGADCSSIGLMNVWYMLLKSFIFLVKFAALHYAEVGDIQQGLGLPGKASL